MKKSANILGLDFETVPCNNDGSINIDLLPTDLSKSCLVLTAGTTASGAIDNLNIANNAAWLHVDAAWAGPLRISQKHGYLLNGVEKADSISISGHKWIFQPKDSSILLFNTRNYSVWIRCNSSNYFNLYLCLPTINKVNRSRNKIS